jgi:hypothetical protein
MIEWRAAIESIKVDTIKHGIGNEPNMVISRCLGSTGRKTIASGPGQASCKSNETQSFKLFGLNERWTSVAPIFVNCSDVEASNSALADGKSPSISDTVMDGGLLKNTVFMQSKRNIHVTNLLE